MSVILSERSEDSRWALPVIPAEDINMILDCFCVLASFPDAGAFFLGAELNRVEVKNTHA